MRWGLSTWKLTKFCINHFEILNQVTKPKSVLMGMGVGVLWRWTYPCWRGRGTHPEFGRLNFLFRRRVIFFINSMEWGNSPTFTGNNHIDIGEWGINLKYIFYFVQYNDLVSKRFCPAFNIIIALVLLRPWLKFDHSVCVTPHLGDQHIVSILVYWCRLNEC